MNRSRMASMPKEAPSTHQTNSRKTMRLTAVTLTLCLSFSINSNIHAETSSLFSESITAQGWLPTTSNSHSLTLNTSSSQWSVQQFQQQFSDERAIHNVSKLEYHQKQGDSQWHLALSNTNDEFHGVVGYTLNSFTVSAMAGNAKAFLRDAGTLHNIDRFGFHGGNNQAFSFTGGAIDHQFSDSTHLQFGFARLDSDVTGLDTRGARYAELSSGPVFTRYTQLNRGSTQIGYAIDAGLAYGDAEFAVQSMSTENNKQLLRLRSLYHLSNATELMFDIGHIDNPLHYDQGQYNVMLSFRHIFGKSGFTPLSVDKTSSDPILKDGKKAKKKRIKRPVLIGAGVVAGVAIASSGSDSQDNAQRSQSQDDAAFNVLNGINPRSVRENREYGGWIYRSQDNSYSSTSPVGGDNDSVLLPNPASVIPQGSKLTASYHTHAAFDPRYDNENFSPQDLNGDNRLGIDGYLATPGGYFKYHRGSNIITLGRIAN